MAGQHRQRDAVACFLILHLALPWISLVLPGELRHDRVHLVHVLLPYFDYEVCITPLIPWKKKKRLINSVY